MIVGLQVYSNSPSERESYGAFVASMNDNHSRFFSRVEQYKTHEDLSDIFANNLLSKTIFITFNFNYFFKI